jgi:hypothetical protein
VRVRVRSLPSQLFVLLMDVQSPSLSSSPPPIIHHTHPQNNIQPCSPTPSSASAPASASSSHFLPPPPLPVHPPPTSDQIDAVIQQATSSVSSDGRHFPLKDTRTQLFVGNVRTTPHFLSISYSSLFWSPPATESHLPVHYPSSSCIIYHWHWHWR